LRNVDRKALRKCFVGGLINQHQCQRGPVITDLRLNLVPAGQQNSCRRNCNSRYRWGRTIQIQTG
jgi:hypothetical protein